MGKRDIKKKKEKELAKKCVELISSDEEEDGNEDLSLKIVQKAALLQACSNSDVPQISPHKITKKIKKKKHLNKDTITNNVEVLLVKDGENADTSKAVESVVVVLPVKDGKNADTSKTDESAEKDPAEKSDSLVFRKLLRGPRYFDPPDTGSGWGACYNCGEEGHASANCISARLRKPCFICGSLEHHVKECMKGQDCYICQKGGHRAKDCPENYKRASKIWKICLKCGDSGSHDMFSCKNEYTAEDLKGIQCYICKSLGHLCCADFPDCSLMELSCYRCGQSGHGGLDCGKLRSGKTIKQSPGKCHACQESGHFAKNCPTSVKDCGELRSKTCFTCGQEGHVGRECHRLNEVEKRKYEFSTPTKKFSKEKVKIKKVKSVPSEVFKAQKRKKAKMEEDQSPSPYGLRKRGGWITEDPIGETQVRRDSPMTPSYNKHMVFSPGVDGRNSSFDNTRYGSTMSYRHGPSNQPYDQYGHDASSEPYRHYRHAPSNESYDRFGHSPNAPYQEVPSRRPHHRYVVSPPDLPYVAYADTPSTGPSPSKRVAHPHHPYGRSPSHEAARAHYQSYPSNGSPNFFQQSYPARFQNSGSDGLQRFRQRNR